MCASKPAFVKSGHILASVAFRSVEYVTVLLEYLDLCHYYLTTYNYACYVSVNYLYNFNIALH